MGSAWDAWGCGIQGLLDMAVSSEVPRGTLGVGGVTYSFGLEGQTTAPAGSEVAMELLGQSINPHAIWLPSLALWNHGYHIQHLSSGRSREELPTPTFPQGLHCCGTMVFTP